MSNKQAQPLKIQFSQKQGEAYQLAMQSGKDIILYGGAIRGGKTRWLLMTVLLYLIDHPNSRGVIVRRDFPTLKKNLLPSLSDLLQSGFEKYITKRNLSDFKFEFSNGSELLLMAESFDTDKDLNRFRGLEVNIIGIDEVNEIQEVTFEKCIERAGSWFKSNAPQKILCTCNPTQNWVKTRFYDRWKQNELPSTWAYIPSKITDNPFTPKSYIEGLKANLHPVFYQRFVDGDWEIQERNLLETSAITILPTIEFDRLAKNNTMYFFFDGAFTDKTYNDPSAILAAFEHDGNLYIRAVQTGWIKVGSDLDKWVANFAISNGYSAKSIIYVEPHASGSSVRNGLRKTTNLRVADFVFTEQSSISYNDSKTTRGFSLSSSLQTGRVFLRQGTWNESFKKELSYFPNAPHDDQVDCAVMANAHLLLSTRPKVFIRQ